MSRRRFPTALIACLLAAAGFARSSAAEATLPASEAPTSQPDLPHCMNSGNDIAHIHAVQKMNAGMPSKYDGYRSILQATTSLELATRLAYAETIAANCPGREEQVLDLIASVIGNRVRIRRGDAKSVVFQRDQFASSLNNYPESRYRDFLCPTNPELWNKASAKMRVNLEGSMPEASIPKDAVNYYLYRHSDRFKAPDWKLEEVGIADQPTSECIRVFRSPAWK